MLAIQLVIAVICGIVACVIASNKGRNAVGWFFGGFFLGLIGIVIVACLSNLKEERARIAQTERERHRLREQLRQERMKNEAYRRHSAARLDAHDQALGVDTRSQPALTAEASGTAYLPPGTAPLTPPVAAETPEAALQRMAGKPPSHPQQAQAQAQPADVQWFYEMGGQANGPVSQLAIHGMLRAGQLTGSTLLWTAGLGEWTPAGQLAAFRSEAAS